MMRNLVSVFAGSIDFNLQKGPFKARTSHSAICHSDGIEPRWRLVL